MEDTEFSGAQLLCPVCSSVVDVTRQDESEFECTNCGQPWTMPLDRETLQRIRTHGI